MKKRILSIAALALLAVPAFSQPAGALAIANSSFETDAVADFPTYRTGITGWEKVGAGGFGVNTNGPFFDNGAVPDGTKVLFLQEAVGVRQMVPGFTAGQNYILQVHANARESTTTPLLRISVGDVEVLAGTPIPAVGGTNPFHVIRKAFVSSVTGTSTVTLESVRGGVDNSLILDKVEIFPAPASTFTGETTMNMLFKSDADTGGSYPWFTAGDGTRGMCYNPYTGHLLVADRGNGGGDTAGFNIYILDPITGAQLGTFNVTGMTGGNFIVNKVAVDDAGRIFVSNLATPGNNFRVYRYASEAAAATQAPVIAYGIDSTPVRWGDDLDVKGSGTSTTILVASRNETRTLVLTDPDNDGTFSPQVFSATIGGISGPGNVAWDPTGNSFWFHRSMTNFVQPHYDYPVVPINLNGDSAGGPFLPNVLAYPTGPISVEQASYGKLLGVGPAEFGIAGATTGVRGLVYNMAQREGPVGQTGGLERAAGSVTNGNGAGDVAIDTTGKRIFFLVPNNSISGWTLPSPPTAAENWMLFE